MVAAPAWAGRMPTLASHRASSGTARERMASIRARAASIASSARLARGLRTGHLPGQLLEGGDRVGEAGPLGIGEVARPVLPVGDDPELRQDAGRGAGGGAADQPLELVRAVPLGQL